MLKIRVDTEDFVKNEKDIVNISSESVPVCARVLDEFVRKYGQDYSKSRLEGVLKVLLRKMAGEMYLSRIPSEESLLNTCVRFTQTKNFEDYVDDVVIYGHKDWDRFVELFNILAYAPVMTTYFDYDFSYEEARKVYDELKVLSANIKSSGDYCSRAYTLVDRMERNSLFNMCYYRGDTDHKIGEMSQDILSGIDAKLNQLKISPNLIDRYVRKVNTDKEVNEKWYDIVYFRKYHYGEPGEKYNKKFLYRLFVEAFEMRELLYFKNDG